MKFRSALWLLAALLLLLGATWMSHRLRRAQALDLIRSGSDAVAAHSPRDANDADPANDDALPDRPSQEMIVHDAARAAAIWQTRARVVMLAKQRKEYGDEAARLLELPYDKAWDGLMALATDGDEGAMKALAAIVMICSAEATRGASSRAAAAPSSYFKQLPKEWASFIDGLADLQRQRHDVRVAGCPNLHDPVDWIDLLMDRYFQPDNPDAMIDVAATNDDHAQAIADLRMLADKYPGTRAKAGLGDMLLTQADAAEQAEGRAILEKIAPTDANVALRLGYCLAHGCDAFPADPDAAQQWLVQSAGLGNELAFYGLAQSFDQSNDPVDAWAWSRFELDLALAGCLEMIEPDYRRLAGLVEDEERRRSTLSSTQYNAGLAVYYGIAGRWTEDAEERLACSDQTQR